MFEKVVTSFYRCALNGIFLFLLTSAWNFECVVVNYKCSNLINAMSLSNVLPAALSTEIQLNKPTA